MVAGSSGGSVTSRPHSQIPQAGQAARGWVSPPSLNWRSALAPRRAWKEYQPLRDLLKYRAPGAYWTRVTQIVQAEPGGRSQRLQLASSIPIVLRCQDGHRIPGKLQCVSLTGGLVVPASLLPPGSMVKLIFVTPKGPVTGTAEMLQPVSPAEQPFRFAAIADSDQQRLHAVIKMVYEPVEIT